MLASIKHNSSKRCRYIKGLIDLSDRLNASILLTVRVKISLSTFLVSASELAKNHWVDKVANPATNISTSLVSLEQAEQYLYDYNLHACELLGINKQ